MLTLKKQNENVFICMMVKGKKRVPVYWHPIVNESLMNGVEDVSHFNTEQLRDDMELNENQAGSIFKSIVEHSVDETNQSKFYKVKRFLQNQLITSMDLSGSGHTFVINFDKGQKYSGHFLVVGGTGSGKTHTYMQLILRNLNGPKEDRRKFIIFSSEYSKDKTLEVLRADKYSDWIEGVDVSEQGLRESQWDTPGEFYMNEVKMRAEHASPGTVLVGDDYQDSCIPHEMRQLFNKLLRVSRHQDVTLILVLHSIRSGAYSSQAFNSVKYIVLYPRSQKGKITAFLNRDLGLTMKQSRNVIRQFSQTGREMFVRLHAPELILNQNNIQLL